MMLDLQPIHGGMCKEAWSTYAVWRTHSSSQAWYRHPHQRDQHCCPQLPFEWQLTVWAPSSPDTMVLSLQSACGLIFTNTIIEPQAIISTTTASC